MTAEERRYLRSIYHHFDHKLIRYTATPEYKELHSEWRDYKTLLKAVFLVLALKADDDGQYRTELKELIQKHNIKLL